MYLVDVVVQHGKRVQEAVNPVHEAVCPKQEDDAAQNHPCSSFVRLFAWSENEWFQKKDKT